MSNTYQDSGSIILYGISLTLVFVMILFYTVNYKLKKWQCTEGKCEKVFGGIYNSFQDCNAKCPEKEKEQQPISTFSCDTSVGICKQFNGPGGDFDTLQKCQNSCKLIDNTYYRYHPYYYTYTYPYYYYRSPSRSRRRHHRRHRK